MQVEENRHQGEQHPKKHPAFHTQLLHGDAKGGGKVHAARTCGDAVCDYTDELWPCGGT